MMRPSVGRGAYVDDIYVYSERGARARERERERDTQKDREREFACMVV